MEKLKIITNNHWRTFDDLATPDWSTDPEDTFVYRGHRYFISEFMRVSAQAPDPMHNWDGYLSDSYFSGILIKYNPENTDEYKVALYLS